MNFIESLQEKLKADLPGVDAQWKMAPSKRKISSVKEADIKKGGVLLLLYQKKGRWYFPLIQRPVYKGPHSGQISFPGGKMEPKDSTIIDTALRETQEEVGLNTSKVEVLGQLTSLYVPVSQTLVYPVVGHLKQNQAFYPDPYEVVTVLEVDLDHLLHQKTNQTIIQLPNKANINTPYYPVQEHRVWGATAMILSEFFTLLKT